MRLFRRQQAEQAFAVQREVLRSNESPEADELRSFQAEHGLDRPLFAHPLDQARFELEQIDARIARHELKIDGLHQSAATAGTYVGFQGKIDYHEAEKARLEELASKLWRKVHPPLIDGDDEYEPLPVCKGGCGTTLDRSELFERFGYCVPCAEVRAGLADPPSPDPDTARVNALLSRL